MAQRATRDGRRLPVLLAAVGLLSSLLLELVHLQTYLRPSASSFCSFGAALDCTTVAASTSSVFLIPWAIWGALGFFALLVAALRGSIWLLPLSGVAALISVLLLIVELTKIGSVCLLCEVVHVVSVALLVVAWTRRDRLVRDWRDFTGLNLLFVVPGTAAIAFVLFVPPYWAAFSYKDSPPFATGKTAEGHPWIGAEAPELTIEEFTDYACPHCKVASAHTLRLLAKNSELRVVRRQNPRMRCRNDKACDAVRAAFCADRQGRFWQADRWLFERNEPGHPVDLTSFARELALNEAELRVCHESPETLAQADAEASFAQKKGLVNTPGYIVDGKRLTTRETEAFLRSGKLPAATQASRN